MEGKWGEWAGDQEVGAEEGQEVEECRIQVVVVDVKGSGGALSDWPSV